MEHLEKAWGERRAPTLKDVAHAVGVSEAAASIVLNGSRSGTRVSPARRQAIVEAAARIGYRPNCVARALQAGQNHRIGFYAGFPEIDSANVFFVELLGGICAGARERGASVVLLNAADDESRILSLLTGASLDGLVVQSRSEDPIFPFLHDLRLPTVSVTDAVEGLPCVAVDDESGGAIQAEHLAARGHRHVLYKASRQASSSIQNRLGAYLAAAKRMGLRTTVRYQDDYDLPLDASDLALVSGGPERASAIVAWHDRAADRVCVQLQEAGLSVPGDVAVVGFDGFAHYYTPQFPLTTLRAPWSEAARTAVGLLSALLSGETVPFLTKVPVEFVAGGTT